MGSGVAGETTDASADPLDREAHLSHGHMNEGTGGKSGTKKKKQGKNVENKEEALRESGELAKRVW